MKPDLKSAILCMGLFALSFFLLNAEGEGYLPSDDYYETAAAVFNEYNESDAVNPSAQGIILNLLDNTVDESEMTETKVLPPLLTPEKSTVRAAGVR